MLFVALLAAIVAITSAYAYYSISKRGANCKRLTPVSVSLASITATDKNYQYPFRDFQIKSSYNSCAVGNFKNDWVDLCALGNAIQQGCRLLDFQVYDINGSTEVAASNSPKYTEKGTYNSLPISDVIQAVANLAFASATCPNFSDPLVLSFRVMSKQVRVFDDIAAALNTFLPDRLLPNTFNYEFQGRNITAMPLTKFIGKVIVMVDKSNAIVESSKLDEYMNLGGNSVFCRILAYNDVIDTPSMPELVEFNKKNVTLCLPSSTSSANNDATVTTPFGVQMCAMCFQSRDSNLDTYAALFDTAGHAFILKDASLRYTPVTVDPLPPPDPSLSYGYKTHKTALYNFNL